MKFSEKVNNEEILWMSSKGEPVALKDMNDKYLLNILGCLCTGRAMWEFVTERSIRRLFEGAEKRGLKHSWKLEDALFNLYLNQEELTYGYILVD